MMRTLATLLLLGLPLVAQLSITVDGQPLEKGGLSQLLQAAQAALDDLEKNPPADAEVLAARRLALNEEIAALGEAIRLFDRLGRAEDDEAELAAKLDLTTRLEEARQELATARAESEQKLTFPTMDAATLDRFVAEAQKAGQAVSQAETHLTPLETALKQRQTFPQALPQQLTVLEAAREGLRQQLEEAPPAAKPRIERQLRANETRQRVLETQRDHQAELLVLDRLQRDLAQVRLELAQSRAALAERRASEARKVLQAVLEEDAERARLEAERQRREAELARSPARRAIAAVKSLATTMESAALADEARLNRLNDSRSITASLLEVANRRLQFSERQIAKDSPVVGSRFALLTQAIARTRQREEELQNFRQRLSEELATSVRDAFHARDELDLFKEVIQESKRPGWSWIDLERGATPGTPAARLLEALADFEEGKADLSPTELQVFNEEWLSAVAALERALEKRRTALEAVLAADDDLREMLDRVASTIDKHLELLEATLLWQRRPAPLSSPGMAAVGAEAQALAADTRGLGERVQASWASWRRAEILGLPLEWGLTAVAALVSAILLARRRRKPAASVLPVRAGLVSALPAAVPLAVLTLGVRGNPPGDVIGVALTAALVVFTGLAFLRGWAAALDGTEQRPDPRRRAVSRVLHLELFLAVAGSVLLVSDAPSLTQILRIIALGVAITLGIWLLGRRKLLCRLVLGSDELPPLGGWVVLTTALTCVALLGVLVLDLCGYQLAAPALAWRSLLAAVSLLLVVGAVHAIGDWLRRRLLPSTSEQAEDEDDPSVQPRHPLVLQTARLLLGTAAAGLLGMLISLLFSVTPSDWRELTTFHITEATDAAPGMTVGRLLKAIVIFTVAVFGARFVREILKRSLKSRGRLQEGSRFAIRTLVSYTIVGIGVLTAISALGLNLEQFGWFITAAGVGIGFGLQEVISNFIAGLILFFERPVQVGDVVTIGSIEGNVQRISIRATTVRSRDGISIIVPNRRFITDDVVNWSHGDPRTRLHVSVGVAYGSDVALVKKILLEVAEREGRIMRRPRPEATFREFGDSQLSFEVLVWLPTPDIGTRRRVASDLNSAIDAAFRRAGITIPFPQRDLHLKTVPAELLDPPEEEPPEQSPQAAEA